MGKVYSEYTEGEVQVFLFYWRNSRESLKRSTYWRPEAITLVFVLNLKVCLSYSTTHHVEKINM